MQHSPFRESDQTRDYTEITFESVVKWLNQTKYNHLTQLKKSTSWKLTTTKEFSVTMWLFPGSFPEVEVTKIILIFKTFVNFLVTNVDFS